jgi:unsaturated rhamnogalacturonyl hydrolase
MYTFAMWMGVQRGYLPKRFKDVALKGYKGVLTKVTLGPDGMTNLTDVSEGTNVSDINYYFARKRPPNDFHGIGAFLIMNEHLRASEGGKMPKMDWTVK